MKKKVLFIVDWPDKVKNVSELQKLLDAEHSDVYEWKVWSCKHYSTVNLWYRWYCYAKGALYAIKNRNKYHAIFIWQQMVGYVLFELLRIFPFQVPRVIFFTFIYNTNTIFKDYKKRLVNNAFRFSKAVVWPSQDMSTEVKQDFPKFDAKSHHSLVPIFEVIDVNNPVKPELDDPAFRNGVFSAGKSERDFNIVIRAFRNTAIPVTIVCADDYVITETNITDNIRILRFAQVPPDQYYALAAQAFCVLISVINEKSPCGALIVSFAMSNSIPIIATDCYGVRDFIINDMNGLLFKVGDADQIRASYEKLYSDIAFRNHIIENAKVTVKEMNPGSFINKVISLIEN